MESIQDKVPREKPPPDGVIFARHFLLQEMITHGERFAVWRAVDQTKGETVALKFFPSGLIRTSADLLTVREILTPVRNLQDPGVVPAHQVTSDPYYSAVVNPWVEGTSLTKLRAGKRREFFDVAEIEEAVRTWIDILDTAHERSCFHGALTPDRILQRPDGSWCMVGFGIDAWLHFAARTILGPTPGDTRAPYSSPGLRRGKPPHSFDDVYALAAIVYEALTGCPPRGPTSWRKNRRPLPMTRQRRKRHGKAGTPIPPGWEHTILAALVPDESRRLIDLREIRVRLGLGRRPAPPTKPSRPTLAGSLPPSNPAGASVIPFTGAASWPPPAGLISRARSEGTAAPPSSAAKSPTVAARAALTAPIVAEPPSAVSSSTLLEAGASETGAVSDPNGGDQTKPRLEAGGTSPKIADQPPTAVALASPDSVPLVADETLSASVEAPAHAGSEANSSPPSETLPGFPVHSRPASIPPRRTGLAAHAEPIPETAPEVASPLPPVTMEPLLPPRPPVRFVGDASEEQGARRGTVSEGQSGHWGTRILRALLVCTIVAAGGVGGLWGWRLYEVRQEFMSLWEEVETFPADAGESERASFEARLLDARPRLTPQQWQTLRDAWLPRAKAPVQPRPSVAAATEGSGR